MVQTVIIIIIIIIIIIRIIGCSFDCLQPSTTDCTSVVCYYLPKRVRHCTAQWGASCKVVFEIFTISHYYYYSSVISFYELQFSFFY
jgi:hypothetical protein